MEVGDLMHVLCVISSYNLFNQIHHTLAQTSQCYAKCGNCLMYIETRTNVYKTLFETEKREEIE